MHKVKHGVSCAGCPHRAAYIACKEALGRGKNKVICGNAGCSATGYMHPAATTCTGGEEALLPRYKQEVPNGGTVDQPAVVACIHFALDTEVAGRTMRPGTSPGLPRRAPSQSSPLWFPAAPSLTQRPSRGCASIWSKTFASMMWSPSIRSTRWHAPISCATC